MNLDDNRKIAFEVKELVNELRREVPELTEKDIESITEQVIWDFMEEETLSTKEMAVLEIERLPDAYRIIRDKKECDKLREAFKSYYIALRSLLISFGMERAFASESPGCIFKCFTPGFNKMVLLLLH